MKTYIGIDNGVTGSIAVIYPDGSYYSIKTPVYRELNYTKTKKQFINRIKTPELRNHLQAVILNSKARNGVFIGFERPMVNAMRFKASISAVRSLEATLIVLEGLDIPFEFIDSKQWQKEFLPPKLTGKDLKTGSKNIGERLYPGSAINGDCDAILIAEYARRKQL